MKRISNLRDAGRKDCFCFEQDPLQEEGQSRGTESPRGGPVSSMKTIDFMINDYSRVTGAHETLEYADLVSIKLRNENVQEFDTRWDEFFSMTQIPSDDFLESL